ncbi:hypothetical protein H4R99_005646 [Coemansia sp. RSA 1722]|nr:hypothetical protein LPJ57_004920 [Coemansia sp. RSA 486]KAJ2227451.1 hypothetical protein IWW45_007026 [Coemansia sp. RSA 485]KAJ2594717.1 hypothetical protein H4R99_005646 [Coemansia sp. RSA 1722]
MNSDHLQESVLATVKAEPFEESDAFTLGRKFDRRINLRGRIAYTVKGTFKGEEAVLKLSWTSKERMPENAAYDTLAISGVEGVPRRLGKGLIFANFMGYRLEYMALDDCGEPLSRALKRLYQIDRLGRFPGVVISFIKQATSCLVNASVDENLARAFMDEKTIDILKGKSCQTMGKLTDITVKDSDTKQKRRKQKRKDADRHEPSEPSKRVLRSHTRKNM